MSDLISRLLPTGGVATLQAVADLLVCLAYLVVPIFLLVSGTGRAHPRRRVFGLLAVFVACCGLVHGMRILSDGTPSSATGAAAVVSAIIAWTAAVFLLRALPKATDAVGQQARGEELGQLRLLEAAVTASGDGVMIAESVPANVGSGPRIVFANPAFEHIMGYSAEEAFGLSPSVFCVPDASTDGGENRSTDPAESETSFEGVRVIRAALRDSQPVRLELPTRRKDGRRVWAEWQLVPVFAADGRHTHWIAVIRDMTDRRGLEEQLRQSQKMEAVGRLAGGIAHDFNNLLTVIRGNADLLRETDSGAEGYTELIDDVRGAADRAAGLIRQLLTFSRRQPARPEVVDLNAVVADLAGLLRRLLGERVSIVTQPHPAPVRVRMDRGQLEQVVVNLAVNARDAMPTGGKLTIGTSDVPDRVGPGGIPTRFARLTLADTGSGMTEAVMARIFEPFFSTKGPGKGTGLGLATVYGIVQQAGGRIAVDSTPGAGTKFKIELPWCDAPSGPTTGMLPVPGRHAASGQGRTVLLVEDESGVRKLARYTLEAQDYAVTEAENGEAALDLLATTHPPDILVTDLSMPGMDGRELAARVRAAFPNVGVVFVSGYAPDAGRLDGVPGAVFLAKPFTPDELLRSTARAIRRLQATAAASA